MSADTKRLVTDAEAARFRHINPYRSAPAGDYCVMLKHHIDALLDTREALIEVAAKLREHHEHHRRVNGHEWEDHCLREFDTLLSQLRGES